MIKTRRDLIRIYLEFFQNKNHKRIPNASLIPELDPTVLFTTAGMHPLVPYLLSQSHPSGKRLCSVQKCIRTQDIEEVGDTYHHTFFEMLGNWSLGDYWKKEAIEFSFEFLTKVLKIPIEKLAVSCFAGDKDAVKDEESAKIWLSLSIPLERIAFLQKENNWWGPAGLTGPCGPDTEMFYWVGKEKAPKKFNPKDQKWLEIWNDVFMQYNKTNSSFEQLKQRNVDTGMGVERTIAMLNGIEDDYLTDSFFPIIKEIEKISKKKYEKNQRQIRIIADHIKASVFILAENIQPSNKERGYILRRLIRRAVRYGRELGMKNFTINIAQPIFEIYDDYEHLSKNKNFILNELEKEESRFLETIENGLQKFKKISKDKKEISGKNAFLLYQSYGFPIEITKELAKENNVKVNEEDYARELEKHQELSRTATEGKFKSGLADASAETTKLHTATHLLNQALREVLKKPIVQKGSNITAERLRFDFNFDRKPTNEETRKVEEIVNKKINEDLPVKKEEMTLEQAKKLGAQALFTEKYNEKVSVYKIGDYSIEVCAGPHVSSTKELGKFKIIKEESIALGIRRIKAVLE